MKLTLPQQDVYFEQLLYPNDPIYNIGAKVAIEGMLDVNVFEKAYQALINQHDTYRTTFRIENVAVIPSIQNHYTGALSFQDFSKSTNAEAEATAFMQANFQKTFEVVSGAFLHKFILVKVAPEKHYLFSVYHHIITDGWGTSLMFQRLVKNYNEIITNGSVISEYPYTYKDFAEDDKAYQTSEAYQKDKAYWLERFKILPEHLFQKKNPNTQEAISDRNAIFIKRSQYNAINLQAKECKVSTFHFILGALFLYFSRVHQNTDFAIGLPVLNRGKSIFKKTVGLFMGISPLRMKIDHNATFAELLTAIRGQLRQDYRHQRFPLGKLAQGLHNFQDKERLFNISLSYEKQNYAAHFQHTKTTVIPLTHGAERVALAIYIREFDEHEDVKIDFDYNLNYFDAVQIKQLTEHFQSLLRELLKNPHAALSSYDFLSVAEKKQLLYDFNDTKVSYQNGTTLLDLIKATVAHSPNAIAVKDANTSLSYKELHEVSNTVAQNIVQLDIKSASIGVLLNRSVATISILLGILKAGKSYIPLDPTFPHSRLQYIVHHSGVATIIADQSYDESFENCELIASETILQTTDDKEFTALPKIEETQTAYIIYTSGSTGNPKGVEIEHKALLNFLRSMQQKPGITPNDTLFAVTTYSFDISILEFFLPLISGASVYIASNETLADYAQTITTLKKQSPTIIQATPSFYQLLINGGWKGNKALTIVCGGDLLSEDLAAQLLSNSKALWNMYGPTETTIWSSTKKITEAKEANNIGSPIANTQFYVLDNQLQLLPKGSIGTLYIGGNGLAKGYVNDPEKTNAQFISNTFNSGRIYNTNDLVKWNEKGELLFLGRNDNQVKIRGFRIELEAIETKLNEIPAITKAVVVAKKQKGQEAFLVAYIQKHDTKYELHNVLEILERQLPLYMIPKVVQEVDDFPLTMNKKIDRKELTQRSIKAKAHTEKLPKTTFQKQLIALWKTVLQYPHNISTIDNFFSLGGHSLNAVKLSHRINEEFSHAIGLKTIFQYPTIASLANYLESLKNEEITHIQPAISKELYAITPSQYQLWVASQTKEKSIAYNMSAAYEVHGKIDQSKLERAISTVIQANEILRTNFVEKQGQVFQKIKSIGQVNFSISLIQTHPEKAQNYIEECINSPFNLAEDLLVRILLIQVNLDTNILVFCTHHIVMDGISLELFTQQLSNALLEQEREENALQFKDYAEWLQNHTDTEKASSFYQEYLKEYVSKESIPVDTITSQTTNKGVDHTVTFSKEFTNDIYKLAQQQKVSVYQLVVTIINSIIFIASEHTDIVVGTVHSGRSHADIATLIGMFVKTVPLRTQFSKQTTFEDVLSSVQHELMRLEAYPEIPLAMTKKELFDVLITYQKPDFSYQEEINIGKLKLRYLPTASIYSRTPLLFNFFQIEDCLKLTISYNTDRYEASTAIYIGELFEKIGTQVVLNSSITLAAIKDKIYNNLSTQVDFDFNF
ncbi:non-ribosomal peptide synthetase [Kordia jejudonensis]|uniref:non-ribosomal peptide synthetase n=1 Tax=Kordia jejudonensis TaxID=1348245 RepID=UPI0006299FD0|nr:non-ribosomal peptide synthetase [Kordia jejudonensis]